MWEQEIQSGILSSSWDPRIFQDGINKNFDVRISVRALLLMLPRRGAPEQASGKGGDGGGEGEEVQGGN